MNINEEVNPIQRFIDDLNETTRLEHGREYNLGMLIRDLEPYRDQHIDVVFDDGTVPGEFMSWRGLYNCLALDYYGSNNHTSAHTLYEMAVQANGHTFEGYKGGDFTMDAGTPIYQANYGECYTVRNNEWETVKVIGVRSEGDRLILLTRVEED